MACHEINTQDHRTTYTHYADWQLTPQRQRTDRQTDGLGATLNAAS